ncbi:methionyl-tRNA formyltransferase [Guptibacillus algicola]|uniref:methionyl-tRNA formyltransferase n=1 Tax=Guptibacillus algicola TaxID=225844 RepID=UPI001CD6307C|nr:methionyl-tRNA formyltransferase [Alkalihalobacillus algicola]MCA0988023.1 methionyl-tRNA formyltransferase [Alkalihalobacillus algicola]
MNIVFMGTPDFSVPVLDMLVEEGYTISGVVTQPDRPKGRKRTLTPPPVKVAAEKHGLPVLQPEKVKEPDQLKEILDLKPDLIVTAAFGQILPKELLDAPEHGCINVHASLLPALRGGAPIHYSILQGKKETGITIMYMVEKLDAGDILTQSVVPIDERDHTGILHDKLSVSGAQLLKETIPELLKGNITPVKQKDEEATFAPNIKRNLERIDWSKTGEEIYNQIRGLHPWPVAFTHYEGNVMKVWWGEKVENEEQTTPGTVLYTEADGPVVATGNTTAIKLTEIQPAGKKRMSASQYLQGRTFEKGSLFGEQHD